MSPPRHARHRHRRPRATREVVGAAVVGAALVGGLAAAAVVATRPSQPSGEQDDRVVSSLAAEVADASSPTASAAPETAAPAAQGTGTVPPEVAVLGDPAQAVPQVAAGSSVSVVGDSLALALSPALADLVPDRRLEYTAQVGSSTTWMLSRLGDLARRDRLAPVVAISSGTNDFNVSTSAYAAHVRAAMDVAGPDRCVVWSTVARPERSDTGTRINQALAEVDAEHPNLIVVDWATMVADDPRLLSADAIHTSSRGLQARASAYAQAILACSPLDPNAPPPTNPAPSGWRGGSESAPDPAPAPSRASSSPAAEPETEPEAPPTPTPPTPTPEPTPEPPVEPPSDPPAAQPPSADASPSTS